MNESDFLATSTNNDIFILDISNRYGIKPDSKVKISQSEGNDNYPVYSPDGKSIAFLSMERAGFEADKKSLLIYDRESGQLKNLMEDIDISVNEFVWAPYANTIYFTAANEIYTSLYHIDAEEGGYSLLIKEICASNLVMSPYGDKIYFKNQNSMMPDEIFSYDIISDEMKQITYVNKELLAGLDMLPVETFWSEGAEGDDEVKVQSIMVKPPRFDEDKMYPMIFLIHGGPQGHWEDDFHFRWNLQMFASRGHVVIAPNPRGSTGYGQKFTDEISRDWGGKVFKDLMNAYEYAIDEFDFIDTNNTFAAGASYGGYMVNWIEGHNNNKFNALFSHDGVYNLESFYGSTEELWFPEWDLGGTPWENRQLYRKWSPSTYVDNFKTPMMIVHGGKDFRIPYTQAFELFTALQKMGVESRFVYFPEENHFVLKPQNARVWWNSMFSWFEKYYKRY
jgi:dipeptidyl aminopeptidase/acylaminoacyl peptidase